MRAYKCDRCGEYFDISNKYDNHRVCLSIFTAERWTTADLCRDCIRSLESWYMIHKLFKKEVNDYEMDTKAEQEVQADVRLEETKEDEE